MARGGRPAVARARGGGAGRELARRRRSVRSLRRQAAVCGRDTDQGPAGFRPRIAVNVSTRAALAVSSGLALALAFPKFDVNFTAWVAFVPLLFAIDGESHRNVFLYSWLQGFACYAASIYWVTITLHHFAGLPIVLAILPMLLLAAVIALFTGLAV